MVKIEARVPEAVQDIASAVITASGLTVSEAVRLFMMRIAADRSLPLDWFAPSAETAQAMQEARNGQVEDTSIDDILAAIDAHRASMVDPLHTT